MAIFAEKLQKSAGFAPRHLNVFRLGCTNKESMVAPVANLPNINNIFLTTDFNFSIGLKRHSIQVFYC